MVWKIQRCIYLQNCFVWTQVGQTFAFGPASLDNPSEEYAWSGCFSDWWWDQWCSCFAWSRFWTCPEPRWNRGLLFFLEALFWMFLHYVHPIILLFSTFHMMFNSGAEFGIIIFYFCRFVFSNMVYCCVFICTSLVHILLYFLNIGGLQYYEIFFIL